MLLKISFIILFYFTTVACAPDSGVQKPTVTQTAPEQGEELTPGNKLLVGSKGNRLFNSVKLINASSGPNETHFIFKSSKKMSIKLSESKFLVGIGCSVVGTKIQLLLHPITSEGQISEVKYSGLGYGSTNINENQDYLLRVILDLPTDCLGVSYEFAVNES